MIMLSIFTDFAVIFYIILIITIIVIFIFIVDTKMLIIIILTIITTWLELLTKSIYKKRNLCRRIFPKGTFFTWFSLRDVTGKHFLFHTFCVGFGWVFILRRKVTCLRCVMRLCTGYVVSSYLYYIFACTVHTYVYIYVLYTCIYILVFIHTCMYTHLRAYIHNTHLL